MSQPVITVENLAKAYAVYSKPADFFWEIVTGRKRHDLFWALQDISFSVGEKERLGIIGPNGSGKTTLLKIITGNLPLTRGHVNVQGRISAMLSLNTTLNPEESGLSNIRFNLLINGCPKAKVEQRTEDIIEFTELGPFIYAPVKTYSSGMNAKLAFAITTAIDPDILVIDEVLSVGDAYFMGKATRRMMELCNRGNALLFVSHSIGAIQMLCNRVVWLENGAVRAIGPTDHILKLYEEDYRRHEDETTRAGNIARRDNLQSMAGISELSSPRCFRARIVADNPRRIFGNTHYIRRIVVRDSTGAAEELSLALPDMPATDRSRLDILFSEWGRLYERGPNVCRILSSCTGKSRGGHLLLTPPPGVGEVWNADVEVEVQSISNRESLTIEFVDYRSGEWRRASAKGTSALDDGWKSFRYRLEMPMIDEKRLPEVRQKIETLSRPPVEILDARVEVEGKTASVVKEREPFRIVVHIRAVDAPALVDVGVRIMRTDGVYIFWQSAGLAGHNLVRPAGEYEVAFDFSENLLGSGDYLISTYSANEWNFPANYPYSEVFDRKLHCLHLKILCEHPGLDFGVLNRRVPVQITQGGRA
ncbi:MAG: ABC transporter ATP-binding protein [Planctomycetota bacterium]